VSGSIGLGAFIGSSYVAARNLPARMYAIFYGAEQCLGMFGAVAIAGHHNPQRQPDQQGTPSVNPIFTSVRLAHRVPVRRTATVQAEPLPSPTIK
jgi:hypothetical protein